MSQHDLSQVSTEELLRALPDEELRRLVGESAVPTGEIRAEAPFSLRELISQGLTGKPSGEATAVDIGVGLLGAAAPALGAAGVAGVARGGSGLLRLLGRGAPARIAQGAASTEATPLGNIVPTVSTLFERGSLAPRRQQSILDVLGRITTTPEGETLPLRDVELLRRIAGELPKRAPANRMLGGSAREAIAAGGPEAQELNRALSAYGRGKRIERIWPRLLRYGIGGAGLGAGYKLTRLLSGD